MPYDSNPGDSGNLSSGVADKGPSSRFADLTQRARDVLEAVVNTYVATGAPVGSKWLAERLGSGLSSATIRHVMAGLEERGLLQAPHVSAGRLPTEAGVRFFVEGLLEVGALGEEDKNCLEAQCAGAGQSLPQRLAQATKALAGLSSHAGLVLAPKLDRPLQKIEFVGLDSTRVLVVLVTADGLVENRILSLPQGVDAEALVNAGAYLNRRLVGRRLSEARGEVEESLRRDRTELDSLTRRLVEEGLAVWAGAQDRPQLLVRGQARLLRDMTALEDVERIQSLMDALETGEAASRLVRAVAEAEGVQIYVGSATPLFDHAGCSVIVAPYHDKDRRVIGAVGVLGPLRMDYARVIPLVDFTARVIARALEGGTAPL